MNYKISFYLSLRLLFGSRKKKSSLVFSKLPRFSIFLIAICIFIPLMILSIINGFQFFVIESNTNFYSSYWLSSEPFIPAFKLPSSTKSFFQDYILLKNGQTATPTLLRAYSDSLLKNEMTKYVSLRGSKLPKKGEILLGEYLSYSLNADIGSKIKTTSLTIDDFDPLKESFLKVVGIVSFQNASLDRSVSLVNKDSLENIFSLNPRTINQISSSSKKDLKNLQPKIPKSSLSSFKNIPTVAQINTQRFFLHILLVSISFICFFSVFITIQITILKNLKNIAILKILSLDEKHILLLFYLQGFLLALIGSMLGLSLSALIIPHIQDILSFIEHIINGWIGLAQPLLPSFIPKDSHFSILPTDVFYINQTPVKMILKDFILQTFAIIFCVLIATFLPVRKFHQSKLINTIKINNL